MARHLAGYLSRWPTILLGTILVAFMPSLAHAVDTAHGVNGAGLGLAWILPFAGLLLSIAILPLAAPRLWHHHYGKIAAVWAATFLLPFAVSSGWETAWYEFRHVIIGDYIPFIVLLGGLFVAVGGIRITGSFHATPATNTALLAGGACLASMIGTTGASMLLIQPLIRANRWRFQTTHTFVFFIFLVGNIGGALTPLGDPPLFIGFLQGVDFFWPTVHLALPMATVAVPLLVIYFVLDSWHMRREGERPSVEPDAEPLGLEGGRNLVILAGIVGAVFASGVWISGIDVSILGVPVPLESALRTAAIVVLGIVSWIITDGDLRKRNDFDWGPMAEVAKLFLAIFITIVPALAIIRAGEHGAVGPLVSALDHGGHPDPAMYFWVTGVLSSFLDNAPTYLIFFDLAGGDASVLQGPLAITLTAISAGAVFMGANTYVGNAPNFMIRSIVESQGCRMPSFFGYMWWATIFLIPLFVVVTLLFFI